MLRRCGIAETDTVLVALSGGADSTALLCALADLHAEGALKGVLAAHLHHGIRGAEADADAAYCEALCQARKVPLVTEHEDVPSFAAANGESLETAGRKLRYAFLRRTMRHCGASCIVTAHHRDDQAETVLMHLLRGCGTNGLSGMRARTDDIARPLLPVSRDAIETYLTERGIPWRTDGTNAEDAALRNRVRHNLLPLLDTFRPNCAQAIAETARLVAEDEDYLSGLAEVAMRAIAVGEGYRREALSALPKPLAVRVIRTLLRRTSDDVTRADIARVSELLTAQSGTCIMLSGGRSAWVDSESVYAGIYPTPQAFETVFHREGETRLPHGTLVAGLVTAWHRPESGNELFIDADALPANAVVRTRRDGDLFYPLGAPGRRKLSDVLIDKKIPLFRRDMPLLAAGSEIYCVFGLTISSLVAIKPDTRHILHIVYKGEDET